DGRESNGVTCSSGPSLPSAIISAGAPNGLTGSYDHGQSYVPFKASHGIGITGTDPIPLYAAQTLTATNANPSDQMSDIYWSAVPSDP
ncbi:hypothetical protein DUT91_25325, partial [Phyllobacterium salinisoli]